MIDGLLEALSHPLRRRVLYDLYDADPATTLTIPDDVATGQRDRKRLTIELVHVHLPKLAEQDLVEWDWDTGEVRRGPDFDQIEPLISLLDDHADELPYEWP